MAFLVLAEYLAGVVGFADRHEDRPGAAKGERCRPVGCSVALDAGADTLSFDVKHFKEYAASAKEPGGWAQYFERYVACTEQEYLERVGGQAAVLKLPTQLTQARIPTWTTHQPNDTKSF